MMHICMQVCMPANGIFTKMLVLTIKTAISIIKKVDYCSMMSLELSFDPRI